MRIIKRLARAKTVVSPERRLSNWSISVKHGGLPPLHRAFANTAAYQRRRRTSFDVATLLGNQTYLIPILYKTS